MKRKGELELDKKDRKLLYLLDVNGRLPFTRLAKKTGMSKQLVKYRIARLESEGFIKGYFPMVDTSRLGFVTFRVYLKFRNLTPSKHEEIVDYLKRQKSIWAVVMLAGKWDVALGVAVKDIYDFYENWDKLLEKYLVNVGDYKISIYSPIYHYSKSYIIGEEDKSRVRVLGGREKAKFDDKDIQILIALSKNARMSLLDLSKKVRLTPESVNYRMKQLEKKEIIQGFRAMIDFSKLGYEFYKAEIRLSSLDRMKDIMGFCHRHSNIYQLDKTIGGETLEVEFHVKSLREMLGIIDEFEKAFPKLIERFDYITVLSEEKTVYMPEI
jgi:Lrp/AsnC family transcriptional regulator, leucine-responsive regulatory protein